MSELQNTFSWSHSRAETLRTCPRRYYYAYYGSWGGWEPGADPRTRELYIQKRLTTRPAWLGSQAHAAAERALRNLRIYRSPVEPARLVEDTLASARREIADSAAGRYRERPSQYNGFQEHYYGPDPGPEAWEEALAELRLLVENFLDCKVYRRLLQVPHKLREVERLEQVQVDGVPCWVRLDALVDDGRGGLVVVDWKTGRSHRRETIERQLGLYGLYGEQRYRVPAHRITALAVNLRSRELLQFRLDPEATERARAEVAESAAQMRRLLRDPAANRAVEEDFPRLPPGSRACASCPFRRSCGREDAASS